MGSDPAWVQLFSMLVFTQFASLELLRVNTERVRWWVGRGRGHTLFSNIEQLSWILLACRQSCVFLYSSIWHTNYLNIYRHIPCGSLSKHQIKNGKWNDETRAAKNEQGVKKSHLQIDDTVKSTEEKKMNSRNVHCNFKKWVKTLAGVCFHVYKNIPHLNALFKWP